MRRYLALVCYALLALSIGTSGALAQGHSNLGVRDWLMDINRSSQSHVFVGTMVIRSARETASAKIWHFGTGTDQFERVDLLTGVAQTTFRRNNEVLIFDHGQKKVFIETRNDLGLFPAVLTQPGNTVDQHYVMQSLGHQRIAGQLASGTALLATDAWRHSFRIWRSQADGVVLKWQTLATPTGPVLEEVAYSEISVGKASGLSADAMRQWLQIPPDYQVIRQVSEAVNMAGLGWTAPTGVPGFLPTSVVRAYGPSVYAPERQVPMVHWVFSDGLSSVSFFIEATTAGNVQPASVSLGATNCVRRRVGAYWVTAVGEVPLTTMHALIDGIRWK
ncbi:MucB/RseB C-terminal domain-containing protein [Burkholderiaceae bacterium]|nr:MucB/RseB C-terminal domain-containing protein [Burkholderiaceae bacterium]MDP4968113.1 MucB/RseB C-terminal domain-containing protein [Burkholderiaceae bacterium]